MGSPHRHADGQVVPKVISVIVSEVTRGDGTPIDHRRNIKQIHTTEGDLLMEHDEWQDNDRLARASNVYAILRDGLTAADDISPSDPARSLSHRRVIVEAIKAMEP